MHTTRLLTPSFSLYRFFVSRTSGAEYICPLSSRTAQLTNARPARTRPKRDGPGVVTVTGSPRRFHVTRLKLRLESPGPRPAAGSGHCGEGPAQTRMTETNWAGLRGFRAEAQPGPRLSLHCAPVSGPLALRSRLRPAAAYAPTGQTSLAFHGLSPRPGPGPATDRQDLRGASAVACLCLH